MKRTTAGLLMILTALAILIGVAAMTGCAGNPKPTTPEATAAVAIKGLDVLTQAGKVAVSVREFERDLHARKLITDTEDVAFDKAFAATQTVADRVIDAVASGRETVTNAAVELLATVESLKITGQNGLAALVDGLKALLTGLKAAGGTDAPSPAFAY